MNAPSTLLVPIDFSKQSRAAAERACGLARASGAAIRFLHALHLPPIATEFGFAGSAWTELRASEEEKLAAFRREFECDGLAISTSMVEDDPVHAIHTASRAPGIEMIVMGSHGRRGLDRFLMGSIAERSLQGASVPVLIVREPDGEAAKPVHSILFATDFSESAQICEQMVSKWALDLKAEVEIVHVALETTALFAPYGVPISSELEEEVLESAHRRMQAVLDRFHAAGVGVKSTIVTGLASVEILKRAEATGARCIAMGSRGNTGLRRLRLGSVVQDVVRQAPCSVLISVPPPGTSP